MTHTAGTAHLSPRTATPLLQIQDLDVTFTTSAGDVPAVRGANLAVYPGQTVAIVGESGSGKSTTAMAISQLLPRNGAITGGRIDFQGRDISRATGKEILALRGSEIGLVPQDPMSNLNPLWRVGFQIKETLVANGVATGKEADTRVVELLAEAGLPDPERRAGQYPHEFSGGMRQRALIAMGLAARPSLLIADEPTSALDVTVQRQILDHLDHLTDSLGAAVLLITHDLGLAAERAQHLVVMYRGHVVESGPALELLQHPQHPYTRRLIAAAPSLASRRLVSAVERAEIREEAEETAYRHYEEDTPTLSTGDDATARNTDVATADDGDAIIAVDNLTKVFTIRGSAPWVPSTPFTAVDDVSFRLCRGTTTAIVGESGSGKSTVAQMVLKLLTPTSGQVRFEGRDVMSMSRQELFSLRRRVQPIFQNPYGTIDPTYSIYRTIEEPLRLHRIGNRKQRIARVRDLLEKVALPTGVMDRYPNELSGGQRQRVAIARALALEPEVVICDEAVSALDVLVQAQVLELLNDLQGELGLSYLFITHDLAVVRQIADEVLVMEHGRVIEQAATESVFTDPQQEYTRRLLDAIPGRSIELAGSDALGDFEEAHSPTTEALSDVDEVPRDEKPSGETDQTYTTGGIV
ncbi:MAG TPA: ABC transporter ATP-binding protein [Brachybacterium massiliense]|uniref:ABC transporter ATP-binding protein n=1 Tax=Brachybacterium massiliense TaxID=1755098 RepID=A0A921MY06_9MICO|nr:ABC transporter ATP-binding protein [Brachybacterium massiliense]